MFVKKITLFSTAFVFLLMISASLVFAQTISNNGVSLNVDGVGGETDKEYTFKITWDTNRIVPTFQDVFLEYKKSTDTSWKSLLSTETSDALLILKETPGTDPSAIGEVQRIFTLTPFGTISGVPSGATTFLDSYDFRINDLSTPSVVFRSEVVTLSLNNQCERSRAKVDVTVVGSSEKDVRFNILEGEDLRGGLKVNYNVKITNQDTNCGNTIFRLSVDGSGVEKDDIGNVPVSQYDISGHSEPHEFTLRENRAETFNVEVEIKDGLTRFGVVNFNVNNVNADAEGFSNLRVSSTSTIFLKALVECIENKVKISFDKPIFENRVGYNGDEVKYLVTVENEDLGDTCDVEDLEVVRLGVNEVKDNVFDIDQYTKNWLLDVQTWSGTEIIKKKYFGDPSTFRISGNNLDYVRFKNSQPFKFRLGAGDEKRFILYVKSSAADSHFGERGVAFCVSGGTGGTVCKPDRYKLLRSEETKPSGAGGIEITTTDLGKGDVIPTEPLEETRSGDGIIESQTETLKEFCEKCTTPNNMGYNTDTQTCLEGSPVGSDDGSANLDKKNWIYFPFEASRTLTGSYTKAELEAGLKDKSFSCDNAPDGVDLSKPVGDSTLATGALAISTDKNSYKIGDTIKISGKLANAKGDEKVVIKVISPDNKVKAQIPVTVSATGDFAHNLAIGKPIQKGNWVIWATYSSFSDKKTVFIDGDIEVTTTDTTGTIVTSKATTEFKINFVEEPTSGKIDEAVIFKWKFEGLTKDDPLKNGEHVDVHCFNPSIEAEIDVDKITKYEWITHKKSPDRISGKIEDVDVDFSAHGFGTGNMDGYEDVFEASFKPDTKGNYYCAAHLVVIKEIIDGENKYRHLVATPTKITVGSIEVEITPRNPGKN